MKLINPQREFRFGDLNYQVRNATLEKIILFQERFSALTEAKDPALQSKIAVYCLYLILKDASPAIPDLTEAWVAQNTPDVEMVDVISEFAFMNRQKVEILRKLTQGNAPVQNGESSSA